MWQVLGIIVLALCQAAHSSVICYSCNGESAKVGKTCSYDRLSVCETVHSCSFIVEATGTWSSGCSTVEAPSPAQTCTFNGTSRRTTCLCSGDFCNDFDKTVDNVLDAWGKAGTAIPMVFPSQMSMECFECGQVNITGVGIIVLPCDAAHTCHGDYCVTKRGVNPHSYCGTVWDGTPSVSCTKMPNEPEVCVCTESFCNPVLDPFLDPTATTTTATTTTTVTVPPAATTTTAPVSTTTTRPATTTTAPAATTTPAATTAAPPGATTTHPKCVNGRFTPNDQAVGMGEKLKNIISNAFGSVNIGWFNSGIDDHICNYSET